MRRKRDVVFRDLAGPKHSLNQTEDSWLVELSAKVDDASTAASLNLGARRDAPESIVSRQTDGSWLAHRYVGELRFRDRVLRIEPRLGWSVIGSWMSAALGVHIVPRTGGTQSSRHSLLELAAAIWRAELRLASRHGLPRLRSGRLHVGSTVHGRIDVPETVRHRSRGEQVVASRSRPRVLDNEITRCIVRADEALDRALPRANWRDRWTSETLTALRPATGRRPALPSAAELSRVRYDPITRRYRGLAELSWRIATGGGPLSGATGENVAGYLIDIAELWELFLLHCAEKAYGASNVVHGTRAGGRTYLLESLERPGETMGRLYPDIVAALPNGPIVIDAKYKRIDGARRVDREDVYQLTSYMSGVRPMPGVGVLGYVEEAGAQGSAYEEVFGAWSLRSGQRLRFARLPATQDECISALRELAQ